MSQDLLIILLELETLALVTVCIALFFILRQSRTLKYAKATVDDVLDTPDRGVILFDEDKKFYQSNALASKFVTFIGKHHGRGEQSSSLTLADFLDYTFDNAVDSDENLKGTLKKFQHEPEGDAFREIIYWDEGKLCLVDVSQTANGRYVINLYDLSAVQREEKEAKRLIDYSENLASAVEAATNGIVIAKRSEEGYGLIFANKAFYVLSSLEEEQVIGQDAKRVFYSFINDHESRKAVYDALKDLGEVFVELKSNHPSNPRWFSMKLTPAALMGEEEEAFIAVFTDITDLKIREHDFARSQKMDALGQLAAGVAHDFNNILSIISGYSRIAMNTIEDQALLDYMEKIQGATDRGAKLTSQLLTFSRHKVVDGEVINFSAVVEEQESLLRPLLPSSIEVVCKIFNEPLMIEAPSDHITQMIMNLSLNAKDAMPDGGRITMEARRLEPDDMSEAVKEKYGENAVCCFSLSDNGSGMNQATIDRIFDPFFTTKDTGQVKGTGLGLFMVYGLLKQMNGHIEVESEKGDGTTFTIYWPITNKQQTKAIQGDLTDLSTLRLDGYTVLIAEDEPDLRDIVSNMLEELGMTVLSASNGNEALMMQDDYLDKIDLLLTDVVMPELNGVKLAELFLGERPGTPVVFMSGYPAGSKEFKNEMPQNSIFIAKPIKYDQLIRIVFQILQNPNLEGDALREALSNQDTQAAHWQ